MTRTSIIYGFYTSGSTGLPKCCLNVHLGLANRFKFNTSVMPLIPGDSILQNSKHTFDPVLWQVLWPLTRGAKVIIPKRNGLLDIKKTVNIINDNNVVMTDIVPSVLTVLLDFLERNPNQIPKTKSLKELFVGGEETTIQLLNRVRKVMPWLRLTNTYGPTEAAIGMIYHHFDGSETSDIPLGKPIPGTVALVVDEEFNPVDEDTVGQLVIGGHCLGAGYYNDLTKTNSVFKKIQVGQSDVRIFLTGDRAVKSNGNIYFRGRTDKQIKIRGVRVELKEIESSFEEHPDVLQFRVIPITDDQHQVTLLAFYTSQKSIDEKILRRFAINTLPKEFMPNKFVKIDSFGTTSSGKIDRSQLKQLALAAIENRDEKSESATKIQNILLDLTGIDFGYEDNLFDAGLDSLDAMKVRVHGDIEGFQGILRSKGN